MFQLSSQLTPLMEHEIEARWPPSCRTRWVGSGVRTAWTPEALMSRFPSAGGGGEGLRFSGSPWAGIPLWCLTQQRFCPLSSLETAHPEHFSYCIDELPRPLGGAGPPQLPEGSFLFIFWEVTALDPSALAVTLGTLPWTVAHSHLGCSESERGYAEACRGQGWYSGPAFLTHHRALRSDPGS